MNRISYGFFYCFHVDLKQFFSACLFLKSVANTCCQTLVCHLFFQCKCVSLLIQTEFYFSFPPAISFIFKHRALLFCYNFCYSINFYKVKGNSKFYQIIIIIDRWWKEKHQPELGSFLVNPLKTPAQNL